MIRLLVLVVLLLSLLTTLGCSDSSDVAGGSIEISNGYIVGTILNKYGFEEGGVVVKLIPSNYNPLQDNIDMILIDTTNEYGTYEFDSLIEGSYNIIARDSSNNNAVMINSLIVESNSSDTLVNTIKETGSVKTYVPEMIKVEGGYVIFIGTDISSNVDAGLDSIIVDSLASGNYDELIIISKDLSDSVVVEDELVVVSGSEIILPYSFAVLMVGVDTTDMVNILADYVSEVGGMPVIKAIAEFSISDTENVDVIYISYNSELTKDEVATLKDIEKPIICSKGEYFEGLGFTAGASNLYGYEDINRAIIDVDTHAITQGFFAADSSIEIYNDASSDPLISWGSPWGTSVRIANGTLNQSHAVWFTFEAGDEMNGLSAPAKRAAIGITKGRNLHESGIVLFKNTVKWAIK